LCYFALSNEEAARSINQIALLESNPQTGNRVGDSFCSIPIKAASLLSAPTRTTRTSTALFITGSDNVTEPGTFYYYMVEIFLIANKNKQNKNKTLLFQRGEPTF
jgi:hypothetical protein